jgi:hypothetical protein
MSVHVTRGRIARPAECRRRAIGHVATLGAVARSAEPRASGEPAVGHPGRHLAMIGSVDPHFVSSVGGGDRTRRHGPRRGRDGVERGASTLRAVGGARHWPGPEPNPSASVADHDIGLKEGRPRPHPHLRPGPRASSALIRPKPLAPGGSLPSPGVGARPSPRVAGRPRRQSQHSPHGTSWHGPMPAVRNVPRR